MRVVLADDHHLVRAGIRGLVEAIDGVEIAGETGDGHEALELIERTRPHVALVDISMPGLNGIELARRVREISPSTRVIILSMHASEGYVAQALRSGVSGYLLKDSAAEELRLALDAVRRDEVYLSPSISTTVVRSLMAEDRPLDDPLAALTPRQREILQLVAEGASTKEIAARLGISVKTVETHRTQLMERLGIHDVPGLVRFAIRSGLVSADG
ncbi:MAG: response regulator transcription factor [Acidobacteriota bacterium]